MNLALAIFYHFNQDTILMENTSVSVSYSVAWRNQQDQYQEVRSEFSFEDVNDAAGPHLNAFKLVQIQGLEEIKNRLPQAMDQGLRGAAVKAHLRVSQGQPRQSREAKSNLHCTDHYWHASIDTENEYRDHFDIKHKPLALWSKWLPALQQQCEQGFDEASSTVLVELIVKHLNM